GGTTDVAIFVEGALSYSSVIPIGAINITKDLAAGLRISLESAEKIKLLLGQTPKLPALSDEEEKTRPTRSEKTDELDVSGLGLPEELRILSRKTLTEGIIKPRLNEIFTMVALELKRSGFGGMTPSGVVITGGGAETVGAVECARRNLAMSVHIGLPKRVSGLIDEITNSAYTTSVGLLLYGASNEKTGEGAFFSGFGKIGEKVQIKGIAGKLIDLVKSFMP
ncbi:MAG: hypothetical protein EHM28_14795, partial [Spirochaetaceae bacterium]